MQDLIWLLIIQLNSFLCLMPGYSYSIAEEPALLLPERAIFFTDLATLIIADVHMGKVSHFRKAGIAVPQAASQANLEKLITLLMTVRPKRLIFIGDLFHSHYNSEWEGLAPIIKQFGSCSFELLPGNHDIMSVLQYERHGLIVLPKKVELTKNILLTHEPPDEELSGYVISGHLHPAVTLRGRGRQVATLPCFWFGKKQAILPAFGSFTGMKPIKPNVRDSVFAILKNEILDVSSSAIENNADRKFKTG